ncbi:kinase-like domain-containing protein [Clohesyomyces aquaticus]|uniref:Kinase-like domain-containing protein n=1 Tax=Clohesyomyces aquaticus TaxID=1231657 RepID=A0A1Y1YHD0_9PLEO|nr:kinase-like domain-containing protein [Clohesyomyces aquaticus]
MQHQRRDTISALLLAAVWYNHCSSYAVARFHTRGIRNPEHRTIPRLWWGSDTTKRWSKPASPQLESSWAHTSSPDFFAAVSINGEQKRMTSVFKIDKRKERGSSMSDHLSICPWWNECFEMRVTEVSVLEVQIFDQKKSKRKDGGFLGLATIPIGSVVDWNNFAPEISLEPLVPQPFTLDRLHPGATISSLESSRRLREASVQNLPVGGQEVPTQEDIANGREEIRASLEPVYPITRGSIPSASGPTVSKTSSVIQMPRPARPQSVERSILQLFQESREMRPSFSDADIVRISTYLQNTGRKDWASTPRLYAVLRLINQLELIGTFVEQGEPLPFQVVSRLGIGAHGHVDKVISELSHREYARKLFRRMRGVSNGAVKSFLVELQILKRVQHFHCVEMVQSYTDQKYFAILMSPVGDCNLFDYYELALQSPDKSTLLQGFFGCLANALQYIHRIKIRHRDIKPHNILVKGDRVLLTDFGIALDWENLSRSTTTADSGKTWAYAAPEVARYERRNTAADIWSLGCVFVEMLTVLNGQPVSALRRAFERESGNYRFYDNISRLQIWAFDMKVNGPAKSNEATLKWTMAMLQEDP